MSLTDVAIATGAGSGLIPPLVPKNKFLRLLCKPLRPGTYGSLAALLACYLLWTNPFVYMFATAAMIILGLWSVAGAEKWLGERVDWEGNARTRDQNEIVIDEWVGVFLTFGPFVFQQIEPSLVMIAAGFVAFRLADTLKWWPVAFFDRDESPAGVMIAAFYGIAGAAAAYMLLG